MESISIWEVVGIFILCFGVTAASMVLIHRADEYSKNNARKRKKRKPDE
tara:strand:- start:165 stop:311 length:147 start_codon:yes stop_codon:yes gene_type:complete